MKEKDLKVLIKETIKRIVKETLPKKDGAGWKYKDESSRRYGSLFLSIMSNSIKSLKDYKVDYSDPGNYTFLFYILLLKQDANESGGTLKYLLSFAKSYKANIRIFMDSYKICVEVRVPRHVDIV